MKLPASILALTLIVVVGLSCNLAEKIGAADKGVVVDQLWPDVPGFPGATKSDIALPLPMRLIFGTMMKGKMQFITFKTDKPVDDVKNFYKGDGMKTAGWARIEDSCFRDTEQMQTDGKLCLFTKGAQNAKQEMVGVMTQEQQAGTTIFYIRLDMTQMEQK